MDGCLDVWDYMFKQNDPTLSLQVCSYILVFVSLYLFLCIYRTQEYFPNSNLHFRMTLFFFILNQSQNAKRASSQKRHMVISIFLPCNSLILMSIGAGSIRAIKGGLDKVFKIRDRLHRICRQILR